MKDRKRKSKKDVITDTVGHPNWISKKIRGPILLAFIDDLSELNNQNGLPNQDVCLAIEQALIDIEIQINSIYEGDDLYIKWVNFRELYKEWNDIGYSGQQVTSANSNARGDILNRIVARCGGIKKSMKKVIKNNKKRCFDRRLARYQLSRFEQLNALAVNSSGQQYFIKNILRNFSQKVTETSQLMTNIP